jgi:glycosyltransferase involved in cell wall biosynthesis
VKVAIVAEYYPRAEDPTSGIWAHRQAVAAREAGADVRVLVLHRPLPPLALLRTFDVDALARVFRHPARARLDGIDVRYVRYMSPPRPWSYGAWGLWSAPVLALALSQLRREFAFELVHAHYAVPAGDAVRRAAPATPLVVSVHGGDVYATIARPMGAGAVTGTLAHARLVLANSAGIARRCAEHGARATRVVHLGGVGPGTASAAPTATASSPQANLPGIRRSRIPTLVTVAHLVARKRHADVITALARLSSRHPDLRYVVVGDGPERERLLALARSLGVADRVELRGQLPPDQAAACAREGTLFVLPSLDEAFGVAYVEAMAGGVPAIGCRGEDGPEEIAAAGGGIVLVARGDTEELARAIDGLLSDPARRAALGAQAAATVQSAFTWERCGQETVAAYRAVLTGDV